MIQYNTITNKTRKHNKTEQYIMKYTKKNIRPTIYYNIIK